MSSLPPVGRAPVARGLVGPRERVGLAWRFDWIIAGSALVLSLLGSLLVWSATKPRLLDSGGDPKAYLERHLLNLAIGLVLAVVFALVDYRSLRAYAPLIYVASCLGLVAVLLVGTHDQRGALLDRARRRVPGPAERVREGRAGGRDGGAARANGGPRSRRPAAPTCRWSWRWPPYRWGW